MTPTEHIQGMLEQPHMKATLDHLISTNAIYAQAYAALTPGTFQVGDVAQRILSRRALEPGRLEKIEYDTEQATYRIRTCQSHENINIVDQLVNDCGDLIAETRRLHAWNQQVRDNLNTYRQTVREAIETIFGPQASLESEEATLLRGPEPCHDAEAVIDALKRIKERQLDVIMPPGWFLYSLKHEHTDIRPDGEIHSPIRWSAQVKSIDGRYLSKGQGSTAQSAIKGAIFGVDHVPG